MKIKVDTNKVDIVECDIVNKGEYKVHKCNFEFSEEYKNLTKKAIFVDVINYIKKEIPIIDDQCDIPYEVLNGDDIELRVYAYDILDEELVLRYSPSYSEFRLYSGSYIEGATESEEITLTQFEQYTDAMNKGLIKVDESLKVLDETNKKTIENGEYAKTQGENAKNIVKTIEEKLSNGELNGADGRDGIDGKNGVDGKPGLDGKDGKPGLDGKDGVNGKDGKDANINGLNILNIIGGTNIELEQTNDTLKINNTYKYDDSEIKESISSNTSNISKNKDDIKEINDNLINYSSITQTGSKIELNMNSETFKIKAILKDKNNNIVNTSNEIDISGLITGLVNNTDLVKMLVDYIKKDDIATDSAVGVITSRSNMGFGVDNSGKPFASAWSYDRYLSANNASFISKGTLETVLNERLGTSNVNIQSINEEEMR